MKIYILEVPKKLQPKSQPFVYPAYNKDYGVEQDFYDYLQTNKLLITSKPKDADWHYLPIFWTRWHLNHEYGNIGVKDLQSIVDKIIINPQKTFTVCQYDDGPLVEIGDTVQFLSSRKDRKNRDAPLLASSVSRINRITRKKYLASFSGRLSTSPFRIKMNNNLQNKKNILINDGDIGVNDYIRLLQSSYISLAPRGYGGSSFRFYEAMQLGSVPMLIGDIDTRPFKDYIDWDTVSIYSNNVNRISDLIDSYSLSQLKRMGKLAQKVYSDKLAYQKWCKLLLDELASIKI